MKGYFSQLAKRTGLGFQPHHTPRANGLPGQPALAGRDRLSPLHVEEVTVVSPSPSHEAGLNVSVSAVEASSGFAAERATENPAPPETIERAILEETSHADKSEREWLTRAPEAERPGLQKSVPESQSHMIPEAASETRLQSSIEEIEEVERRSVAPEQKIEETPERLTRDREPASPESGAQIPPDRSQPDHLARVRQPVRAHQSFTADQMSEGRREQTSGASHKVGEEGSALKPFAESFAQSSRAETLQAYLRGAQEWVASPPVEVEEEKNPSGHRPEPEAPFEPEAIVAPYTHHARTESSPEVETQDFHLSIGTISIVIEEPQKQAVSQTIQPATPTPAAAPKGAASETSRLSRHYISVR